MQPHSNSLQTDRGRITVFRSSNVTRRPRLLSFFVRRRRRYRWGALFPLTFPSGEGTTLGSLLRLIPPAQRLEWSEDHAQLERWKAGGFIGQSMNYPSLFWPAFAECGDCVFLAARSPGSYDLSRWLNREGGNRRAVESELNRIYMGDLFTGHPAEPTRGQVIWLAQLLQKMWGRKLQLEFPHRRVLVAFNEGAADVLRSYISFCQAPGAAADTGGM